MLDQFNKNAIKFKNKICYRGRMAEVMISTLSKNLEKIYFKFKKYRSYRFQESKNDEINILVLYYGEYQITKDEAVTSIHKKEHM